MLTFTDAKHIEQPNLRNQLTRKMRGGLDTLRPTLSQCMKQSAMIVSDSDRGFGFLLTETARLFRRVVDRRLHPLGLTRAQWSVLAILSNRDGLSQSLWLTSSKSRRPPPAA